ncbi:MAG: hypothetical protein V2A75_03175 [Pseudomonadota bacterium]
MKRCLLITPLSFYTWHSTMAKELIGRGYSVDTMNDEYPEGLLGLLLGNFLNVISRKITLSRFREYFEDDSRRYDLIIIFKGRGVSADLLKLLKLNSNRVVAYNFDSFNYFSNPLQWYKEVSVYKTFDFVDAIEHQIERVDLFSDSLIEVLPEKTVDISCVIKNHSDRLVYLNQIYSALHKDLSFKIFIYEKNLLTLLKNSLVHPFLIYKWRKHIYFNGLNQTDYFNLLAISKFTLDYAHPSQSGITMRCFQSAACGTIVITNNGHIQMSDKLSEDNYFVYKLDDDLKKLEKFIKDKIGAKPVVNYRGVSNFIDDLLQ